MYPTSEELELITEKIGDIVDCKILSRAAEDRNDNPLLDLYSSTLYPQLKKKNISNDLFHRYSNYEKEVLSIIVPKLKAKIFIAIDELGTSKDDLNYNSICTLYLKVSGELEYVILNQK